MLGCMVKPFINSLATFVFIFASQFEAIASVGNGHKVTQSLAIRFNSHTPTNFVNSPFQLKQYFVPESWAQVLQDGNLIGWQRFVSDANKPGWIRILIHPFDNESSSKIEAALKESGLSHIASQFGESFRITESRSLYPDSIFANATPVSPRLSMTDGFGKWAGTEIEDDGFGNRHRILTKLISSEQAKFAYQASEIIQKRLKGTKGTFFQIQPDRMVVLVKSPSGNLNLGETFRDISDVVKPGEYSLPGFINQDLRALSLLSMINDSGSALSYLRDVVAPIRGQGIAEFYGRTGFVHSSPHSQNFLETSDESFRIIQKLKIRDLADLIPTVDERSRNPVMAKLFEDFADAREALQAKLDGGESHFALRHSFFKGSGPHRIFAREVQREIELSVSKAFIATLSKMSGVSTAAIESITERLFNDVETDYAVTRFDRNSTIWADVQAGLLRFRQNPYEIAGSFGTYRRLKETNPKNIEIERSLKSAAAHVLKGEMIPPNLRDQIDGYWILRNKLGLSAAQNQFIAKALITLDIYPSQDLRSFFEVAVLGSKSGTERESIIKLHFKNIEKEGSDAHKHFFLNWLTSKNDLIKNLSRSEKDLIKNGLEDLLGGIRSRSKKPPSPKIAEAIFFALLPFSNYINDATSGFLSYISEAGGVPVSIQDYLRNWHLENKKEVGWITRDILNAKGLPVDASPTYLQCRTMFRIKD